MTRAEFIQQAILGVMRSATLKPAVTFEEALLPAMTAADALEASNKAPWSEPSESAILKRIEDEAHRKGYLLGLEDGRRYAKEEAAKEEGTVTREHTQEIVHALRLHLSFHRASFLRLGGGGWLPQSEVSVDAFIAERTKLWRETWIFPLLDELAGVDPDASRRAASDPSFRCSRCGAPIPIGGEGVPELCERCCNDNDSVIGCEHCRPASGKLPSGG